MENPLHLGIGGDPCTFRESGELQAEISKLTHPARPDVDWLRVETLSLALFRQNGIELQTLVCYVLAKAKRQGLTGMAEGLEALEAVLTRQWRDVWPVQVHARVTLLSWLAEKLQQVLRAQDIQYQDLALMYRCEQHLTSSEAVLRKCELWHLTRLEALAGQFRNLALRLERLHPQGAEMLRVSVPKSHEPVLPLPAASLVQKPEQTSPAMLQMAGSSGRGWWLFLAGMLLMTCLGGAGYWGWLQYSLPGKEVQERDALPLSALGEYAKAQEQLQHLSQQLDALDERKGKYMTASELKSAVFAIRQSLQTPPLEELLRQLAEQKEAGDIPPALVGQIDTRFEQLRNRYLLLKKEEGDNRP